MPTDAMPLSERELEIVRLVATGATNQQIACELVISVNTVKVHLRNIFSKLEVESRTEATMWAVQQGLIPVVNKPAEETVAEQSGAVEPAPKPAEILSRPPEPISFARRVFFVVSATLVMALAFVPPLLHSSASVEGESASAFVDRVPDRSNNSLSPASRWSSRAEMPVPRARLAVTALNKLVYAIGGDSGGAASDAVEAYDPTQNAWQIRARKPTAVSNVGAVSVDGLIYVPGGMVGTDQVTTTLEAYDPLKDRWTSLRPLPTPLCAYAVAAVGKRIYLFGGWDGKAYLDTVHIYEPVTDTWTLGSPMPVPRAFAGAGVIENRVYVVGGYNEKQEFSVCEEYDPALEGSGESPWRERAPMTVPRGGIAVTIMGDNLFAIGGGWQGGLAYNERYDPHSNAWFRFESPVLGQWRNLGVAAVDVSLYAIGGWSGEYLSTNQEYQALYRIILPISPR